MLNLRAQPTVDAQCGTVNEGAKSEIVKDLSARSPYIRGVVLLHAFVVKAVDLGDLSRFVIASDEGHSVGMADLEGEEEEEGLHGVEASIYKVAEEEVIDLRTVASYFEEFTEIEELAMDVATCVCGFEECKRRRRRGLERRR